MGCTRCGTDSKLIELMFNKLMQEALKDGTLQAGLVDCAEKRLGKNTNVLTCVALEDAVCELFTEGKICINEPITIHFDPATGKLSLGMKNGEVMETTIDLIDKDTIVQSLTLNTNKELVLRHTDGSEVKVPLKNLLSAVAVENPNGTIQFTGTDGKSVTIKQPKAGTGIRVADDGTISVQSTHNASVLLEGLFDEPVGHIHATTGGNS